MERQPFNNIILIAGAGRNSGKTKLACQIIAHLSEQQEVVAIKVSPHFHALPDDASLLFDSPEIVISEEIDTGNKDSARMKQAGAARSFYVQVADPHLPQLIAWLREYWSGSLLVCESGGLIEYVRPARFLFVHKAIIPAEKKTLLDYRPELVQYRNGTFTFDMATIVTENGRLKKKNES